MPRQQLLQGFHKGTIEINSTVSLLSKDGITTYFVGGDNCSFHHDGDDESRRFALVQLMLNRHARPVEIERSALGIPHRTLMNWQRKFQEGGGAASFFRPPARGRSPVLTQPKTLECEALLAQGLSIPEATREAGVGESTLRKAVAAGRVERLAREARGAGAPAADKSQRSRADAQAAAGMGVACTRPDERVAAAVGLLLQRRQTPRKIKLSDLPEDQRPTALKTPGKRLVDIVKMIAYRAETALVAQVLPHLGKAADWCPGFQLPVSACGATQAEIKLRRKVCGIYDILLGIVSRHPLPLRLALNGHPLPQACGVDNPGCPPTRS